MARPVVALQPPDSHRRTGPTIVTHLLSTACRIRTATIGAALSLLVVLLMAGTAIACADGACRPLPAPGAGGAALQLSPTPRPTIPGSAAPIARGPQPPQR
jgi:hypothetical protein